MKRFLAVIVVMVLFSTAAGAGSTARDYGARNDPNIAIPSLSIVPTQQPDAIHKEFLPDPVTAEPENTTNQQERQ